MIKKFSLIFVTTIVAAAAYGSDFKIHHSTRDGITVEKTDKKNGQGTSGPMSVRFLNKIHWVSDSNGARIVKATNDKKTSTIKLSTPSGSLKPGDIAFSPNAKGQLTWVWMINLSNNSVVKFNPRGDAVYTIDSEFSKNLKFSGLKYIEADNRGHIFLGDNDQQKIFEFNPEGAFVKVYPWNGTAFCLDTKNILYTSLADADGWKLQQTHTLSGKTRSVPLNNLGRNANPDLWGFSDGKLIFTAQEAGLQGHFIGAIDLKSGRFTNQGFLGGIPEMTRYITVNDNQIWRAVTSYHGSQKYLRLIKLMLEGEAEG